MKKINLLLLAIIAIAMTFTACNTEINDYGAPTIVINQADQTVDAGQDIIFTGTVASLGKIKEVRFFTSGTQLGETVTSFSNDSLYTFSVPISNIQETFEFKVQATDDKDQQSYETVTITVSTAPAMNEYTGLSMAYVSTETTGLNIFNAGTGALMTGSGTAADMDLVWAYNGANATLLYSISSPNSTWLEDAWYQTDWSATGKNTTQIMQYTATTYAAITAETLNALTIGSPVADVHELTNGEMVAFITADGYKGVIEVTNVGVAKITASCTANVKVVGAVVTK